MEEQTDYFGTKIEVDASTHSLVSNHDKDLTLDAAGKQLITNPRVIAFIMKNTIDVFQQQSIDEICSQLSNPASDTYVRPDIHYSPTEHTSLTDGTIRFDVLVDTTNGHICTVDIELQGSISQGYQLTTRGVYYLSRLISKQLRDITGPAKYRHIHKVYSIWLCPKTAEFEKGGISRFKMECVDNGAGMGAAALAGADMMEMIFIRAGKDNSTDIMKFINGLKRDREQLTHLFELQEEVTDYMEFFKELEQDIREEVRAKVEDEVRAEVEDEVRAEVLQSACLKYAKNRLLADIPEDTIASALISIFDLSEKDAKDIILQAQLQK